MAHTALPAMVGGWHVAHTALPAMVGIEYVAHTALPAMVGEGNVAHTALPAMVGGGGMWHIQPPYYGGKRENVAHTASLLWWERYTQGGILLCTHLVYPGWYIRPVHGP